MKKILITLFFITFAFNVKSQNYKSVTPNTNEVQWKSITQYNGDIYVYKVVNGIREATPSKIIKKDSQGNYDVYKTRNGVREALPVDKIIKDDN